MKSLLIILFCFICNTVIFAAPPPPPAGSPGCWPPPCVPIDGGIVFLIIAGTLFAIKKLYDFSKKHQSVS